MDAGLWLILRKEDGQYEVNIHTFGLFSKSLGAVQDRMGMSTNGRMGNGGGVVIF
jgi:hypothetical protein